jgi:cyanophycinase-like exopeptidase
VLSYTMNDGYTEYGDSSVGLQLGALDLWYGDADPLHRGLSFGSRRAIFDQHLYERGRFGRLLNETAQTADHLGAGGLVGLGVDTDTAPVIRGDRHISEVFGTSSVTVVDFRSLGARWAWVDESGRPVSNPSPASTPTAALVAHDVLAHVLAPRQGRQTIGYELDRRAPVLDGARVPFPGIRPQSLGLRDLTAERPLILGGDLSVGPSWPEDSKVLRELIARAGSTGPMLVVAAGYADGEVAAADLAAYEEALTLSGWAGATVTKVFPAPVSDAELQGAAAVIFLGGDQGQLPGLLAQRSFERLLRAAAHRAPVTMLDRSIAALAGDVYDGVDDAADWIEAWKASQAQVQRGLGLVRSPRPVAFEPRLQYDYRYGRLFGIPFGSGGRRPVVLGISEATALVVTPTGASVIGQNPVIAVDTGPSTFYLGANGAFGVLNAVLDVYEPGSRRSRPRPGRSTSLLSRDSSDRPASLRR